MVLTSPKGAKAGVFVPPSLRKRSGRNVSASDQYLGLLWKENCAVCTHATGKCVQTVVLAGNK